ncbi:MAG: hypothetical protein L6R39_005020 [Caloplaca ligustica]|nr:MAG: hypothetical protein L6R39_005020 [Caloplaca ligustica]
MVEDVLLKLEDHAATEGDGPFDPSGTSRPPGVDTPSSPQSSSERAQSWHGDAVSANTDLTSISQRLKSLDLDSRPGSAKTFDHEEGDNVSVKDLGSLSAERKKMVLCEMFPLIKEFDVGYILEKVGFDFGRAVEELLSHSFLEQEDADGEEKILKKGVDGFVEQNARGGKTKSRRKKQQMRRTSSTPAPSDSVSATSSPTLSRWDRAKVDVEFLAQRISLPTTTISSAYHASGASLPLTIATLCTSAESVLSPHVALLNAGVIGAHAAELARDFPMLPPSTAKALIQLTHPSTASAHELARATLTPPSARLDALIPQYVLRPPSPPSDTRQSMQRPLALPLSAASRQAYASAMARSNAFTQASAAYRKSKSQPLMGGAASYYSAVGRDATASLRRYEAAAADARVTYQSKAGEIDLHGVNVKDAVRIAQDHVEDWWEVEGQEWARAGKGMGGRGLRIVTGVGRHSEGGKGKLGPAVGAMLVREGWKVEIGEGVIDVVGKARR